MNIATNLESSAFYFPNRLAIRQRDSEITYAQLNARVNRIATGLIKMGVKPGDLIGLCAINSIDWIASYFGILKAGAVAVTFSCLLTGDELANLVSHSTPSCMFTDESKLKEMERLKSDQGLKKIICPGGDIDLLHLMKIGSESFKARERAPSDTATLLYTGGTTGIPKGVARTHGGMNFSSLTAVHYERYIESDVTLHFLPLNHVFGQHTVNSTMLSGSCLELMESFDIGRVLEILGAGRITKFLAVPTVYVRILPLLPDLKKNGGVLRYCFSAAASLPAEICKEWKEKTGILITEGYGMTEAMPVAFNHYYPEKHVVGSVGHLHVGVEVQIRDASGREVEQGSEGEICVRAPHVMKEYLNNREATHSAFWKGGWFRSGDIGRFDHNGYLYIVDRLKDLIISGGENVYPREVEEVLYLRPEIEECAVIGVPNKLWGESVTAVIVPKREQKISLDKLKSFLKSRLSPFKVPKDFIMVEKLPKSPAGKILKREIRNQIENYKSQSQEANEK
jgi:long-chain acyl-CoA synthetase